MNIYIYDYEVFIKDWHVTLQDANTKEIIHITNDPLKLKTFINMTKDNSIFIGFNSKSYDDNILRSILIDIDPWLMNDWIINQKKSPYHYPGFRKAYSIPLYTYDLKNSAINSYNMGLSLKEYEAYCGKSIIESDVDFKIDRKLTDEELIDVIKYCDYDVENTLNMFNEPEQQHRFASRLDLITMFNLDVRKSLNKTDAMITAEIMGATRQTFRDGDIFDFPKEIDLKDQEIIDFFSQPLSDKMALRVERYGMPFIFGIGGLHAAIPNYTYNNPDKPLWLLDYDSYYPSMIIQYLLHSRGVKNPERYKEIYDLRFKLKAEGNSDEKILKLIINTYYGCMDAEFNPLYDQKNRRAISILGQLLMMDYLEKLAPYIKLIQVNTDGIVVEPLNEEMIIKVNEEWSKRTRINIGIDKYKTFTQADVNNYFCIEPNGHVKTKGGALKFYKGGHHFNHNLTIIAKAVGRYLEKGTPLAETIHNIEDIRDYELVTKTSAKYDGQKVFVDGSEYQLQRVNRVFASTNERISPIYKWRMVDGEYKQAKQARTPDHAYVYNGEIKDLNVENIQLDYDYYIKEANKVLKRYKKEGE